MYDDYPSPPSTAGSSRRKHLPNLHTHSSPLSSNTHAHNYGQRATKASDIAHLLDPSYSPSRTYDNQIYVDHAGEAHDPDFRLFAPANYSPKRREFLTCESDDDEDVEDEGVSLYSPRRGSFESARRPSSRASDPLYSRTSPESVYATFAYTYTYDDAGYVSEDEPRRESNKLRRRRASLEQEREPVVEPESPEELPRAEWTPSPTCSHAFRRQWHALRLRTQVAAFRARRRVSRIVHPTG